VDCIAGVDRVRPHQEVCSKTVSAHWVSHLYVTSLTGGMLVVFKIEPDKNITAINQIELFSSPDQVGKDTYLSYGD
jgi:hypothetical protein